MRYAPLLLLLVAHVAAADDLVFRARVQAVADPDGKVDSTTLGDALKTTTLVGEIVCPGAKGRLLAWVVFEGGRVTSVDVGGTKDKKHIACVATGLRKLALPSSASRVVAAFELSGGVSLVTAMMNIDVSKLQPGTGPTGIGTGKTGGGGSGQVDFAKGSGPIATGGVQPGGPKVELGDPKSVKSELTADEISRVVRSRAGVFRACYQKELSRAPDLAGTLKFTFTVNETGTVTKAELGDSTMAKGEAVADCIRTQLMRLKFPKGPATIAFPFTFSKQ